MDKGVGSWENYNSWKIFESKKKYLLIKYEDLLKILKKVLFLKFLNLSKV
jgi:hypothetical protein